MAPLATYLGRFVVLFAGTVVLFASLTAAITVLTRRVGEERLRRWVGGNTITAPLKGLVFGVVTPFCSWSAIPVLLGLLRARVRTSAVVAFFIASPVLDPVLVVIFAWLFGLWVAAWFTVFLTAATLLIAVVAERLRLERLVLDRVYADECSRPTSGTPWNGWRDETHEAVRGAGRQMRGLLVPLIVTCAVGVAIAGAAPEQLVVDLAGPEARLAIPIAALPGVPLYLPTETLAPLAWGLREAGVGTGAVFAFLVTAASLSLPELILLFRIFRPRLVIGTVTVISTVAVVGALVVSLVTSGVG